MSFLIDNIFCIIFEKTVSTYFWLPQLYKEMFCERSSLER